MKNPNPSYSWKTVGFGLLLTALFLIPSGFGGSDTEDPWARGASYDLSWFTIGAGGVRLKTGDGVFELRGTIGQPDAGTLTAGPFTLSAGFELAAGTGDADGDGDVDLNDYAAWGACMRGPHEVGCNVFDLDADGDVDLRDYASFLQAFSASP